MQYYSQGKYSINKSLSYHESIEKWIQQEQFLAFEDDSLRLNKKSRKRNKLYNFHSDITNSNLVMKVSQVSKDYKFWRKVDLYISSLFKDYNYNSYKSSIKLRSSGVDTVTPIAYWTYGVSWLNRKSYFLYEKVESDLTVTELCSKVFAANIPNQHELTEAIINRSIDIVKRIHAANIRHDDPHGGNILTDIEFSEVSELKVSDINNSRFTLIDNDRCTSTRISIGFVKQFFDLKCLARFNVCQISPQDLLQRYLGREDNSYWQYSLYFWKSGGFNIKKRINYLFIR